MDTFSLLSLNTFGLPFFLGWWRLGRLAGEIERLSYDLLCLQEIQQNAYVPLMLNKLPGYSSHAYELNLFAPKGGLLTLARLPLESQQFVPYNDRGRLWSVGFADWALLKGVLSVRAQIGAHRVVVMNTHLHANYAGAWTANNRLANTQRNQVRHLAAQVRSQPEDVLVIVCGDFNFPRSTFLYEELIAESGLTDPLAEDPRPTYRPFAMVPSKWSVPLDFLLVRVPVNDPVELKADILTVEFSRARSQLGRFLTDHCALTLKIEWPAS